MFAAVGKRAARQNVFHFAGAMRKNVVLSHPPWRSTQVAEGDGLLNR